MSMVRATRGPGGVRQMAATMTKIAVYGGLPAYVLTKALLALAAGAGL